MLKLFRTPERLFAVSMWIVTFVLASFLLALGGMLMADLPKGSAFPSAREFAVRQEPKLLEIQEQQRGLDDKIGELDRQRAQRQAEYESARQTYQTSKESFKNWLASRGATADSTLDASVIKRNQELDQLNARERSTQAELQAAQRALREAQERLQDLRAEESRGIARHQAEYDSAERLQELKVFGLRLSLTLPLLLVAAWLIKHKRRSQYWPLARGFVFFAGYAFFFELVPYMPSYGGYIHSIVGLGLTTFAAHKFIGWMQAYVARRRAEEQQSADARRARLDNEQALKKLAACVCPGCERPIQTTGEVPADFCVHCGLHLYDHCEAAGCGVRKNAFFAHCPKCGTKALRLPSDEPPAANVHVHVQ